MENFIERLTFLMEKCGINDNQLTVKAGLSVGLIGKAKKTGKGVGSESIEKILQAYPEFSAEWLLRGKGEPLLTDAPENKYLEICKQLLENRQRDIELFLHLSQLLEKDK